jgi:hypothetical protein
MLQNRGTKTLLAVIVLSALAGMSCAQETPDLKATAAAGDTSQAPAAQNTPPGQTAASTQAPPATSPPSQATPADAKPDAPKPQESPKRILGIIPNFQTTNDQDLHPKPLTSKEKYVLAYHQMFDISAHFGNLIQSSVQQATNGEPHYGEGWGAFGERFAAAEGDQYSSSFFIYGFLPAVFHDDPRYFRRGHGSPGSRIWYALSRTVITRTDAQTPTFNAPQVLGQFAQAGISNLYYPSQDRTIKGTFTGWGTNLAYNSMYNLLKEYYPDFLRILKRKQRRADDTTKPAVSISSH